MAALTPNVRTRDPLKRKEETIGGADRVCASTVAVVVAVKVRVHQIQGQTDAGHLHASHSTTHWPRVTLLRPGSLSVSLMDILSHRPVSPHTFSEAELLLSIGLPGIHNIHFPSHTFSLPNKSSSGATSHTKKISRGHRKKRKNSRGKGKSRRHLTTISTLPDNVLLEIFDFCQETLRFINLPGWKWHLLVHVCQRWREIVFASPHRLNLQILCTERSPVKENLGIWPALPIVTQYRHLWKGIPSNDEDNVIAAFQDPNRVYDVGLCVTGSQLRRIVAVAKEPFPVLTRLDIFSMNGNKNGNTPVVPAEFLGGSAPCLQKVYLHGVPFPTLPTLLLSASDLIELDLRNIPPTGYILPEALVVGLVALPRLKLFFIGFQSATATSRPVGISRPPITRTVLPTLTNFRFRGASEYLEDFVARIDCPQLEGITIDYFNQVVDFQAAQLSKFIDRSVGPKLTPFRHAQVTFLSGWVVFTMYRHANHPSSDWLPTTTSIRCRGVDWQVSHMAQVLSQFSATLSNVDHLTFEVHLEENRQLEGTDDVEWLDLLHPFSTVQTLHVSRKLAAHVALALEDITGEMVAEVLPSLALIGIDRQPVSSIEKFVAGRRFSGRPVTVVSTEAEFNTRLESYIII